MKKTPDRESVLMSLKEVEGELRALGLWADESARPDEKAFLSTIPFCLDTMGFHEWLQFIFIPKMTELLNNGGSLPDNVLIHTVAEEVYRGKWNRFKKLIFSLRKLDGLFNIQ
ncbi:MAG: YqcC family protein [Succinivibrio sp.]|nr:YqcC family protein [Succinivibrio sp.]